MITNKDLLNEISNNQLLELSDINATGEINQEVIDDALNDAISLIESFIILPSNPNKLLKKITVDLTIFELKRKNNFLSDEDKELKKENESYLLKMSNGRLKTQTLNTEDTASTINEKPHAFRHKNSRRVNLKSFR